MSPNYRPADAQRTELISMFEVPGWENVFVLGCFARALTIYSQQVRALNLVDALVIEGRLTENSRVAVIGGGFGGVTAAAASIVRGAREVVVFEKTDVFMPIQRQSASRYIHPHIYEWPKTNITKDDAGLPILNWKADTAAEVVRQIDNAWNELLKLEHITGRVKIRKKCGDISIKKNGEKPFIIAKEREQYDLIILAVGFGIDQQEPDTPDYWKFQQKDFENDDKQEWCFSGIGDGGLTDLMWRCITTFHHESLIKEINNKFLASDFDFLNKISNSYETIEQGFIRLAKKLDPLQWEIKGVKKVLLIGPGNELYAEGRSVLNRLIVSYLQEMDAFEFVSGKLKNSKKRNGKYFLTIECDDGKIRKVECDHLIKRYGPKSVLESDFNEIYKACESLKNKWKSLSVAEDFSRCPLYGYEDYKYGTLVDKNGIRKPLTRANPEGKITCIVVKSSADEIGVPLEKWVSVGLKNLERAARQRFLGREIYTVPYPVSAIDCFKEPALYEWTVRAICDCELAVFDLTENQPSVFILLGIRAAVRRGVTVTVSQNPQASVDLPFNIMGLNPLSLSEKNFSQLLSSAFDKGIAALQAQPESYLDLPAFDALRRLTEEVDIIPAEQEVLMLCWFDSEYQKHVSAFIKVLIPQIHDCADTQVVTTLDNQSPQLVAQRLYSTIRRTQLCLVDWTGWRPNVFFELGVRLAVNEIDPIHILIPEKPNNWEKTNTKWPKASPEADTLEAFFRPLKFQIDDCSILEQRISQFLDPDSFIAAEGAIISTGRTFRVVQECIRQRSGAGEPGMYSPDELLLSAASALAGPAGPETGIPPVLYPDALAIRARDIAFENLSAAWFYLLGRYPGLSSSATETHELDKAREKLLVIANEIEIRYELDKNRRPELNSFVEQVRSIRVVNDRGRESIINQARKAKNDAIKYRDGKPEEGIKRNFSTAVNILKEMLKKIGDVLNAYKNESPDRMVDQLERNIAFQAVHLNGSLGGIYRRWGKLEKAIDAYEAGAIIEQNGRYKLIETYASTQYMVVRCLAKPELIVDDGLTEHSTFRAELNKLRRHISRVSQGDVYKTADVAIVSLLLGHAKWRKDLMDFLTIARARNEDYAKQTTFKVIRELNTAVKELKAEHRDTLLHWDEAMHFLL